MNVLKTFIQIFLDFFQKCGCRRLFNKIMNMKNGSHNPSSKEDPTLSGLGKHLDGHCTHCSFCLVSWSALKNVDVSDPETDDSQTGGDSGIGACGWLLFVISWLLVMVTLPFSLCVLIKVSAVIIDINSWIYVFVALEGLLSVCICRT